MIELSERAYRAAILSLNPALPQTVRALVESGIATEAQAEAYVDSVVRQVREAEAKRPRRRWWQL